MGTGNAATAVVATSITVWGVATGLSYEVLLAGFAGGLVSLSFLAPLTVWQRIWTPVTATLTAGYSAPIVSHHITELAPDDVSMLPFSAFIIGLTTQILIPFAMREVRRRLSSGGAAE